MVFDGLYGILHKFYCRNVAQRLKNFLVGFFTLQKANKPLLDEFCEKCEKLLTNSCFF